MPSIQPPITSSSRGHSYKKNLRPLDGSEQISCFESKHLVKTLQMSQHVYLSIHYLRVADPDSDPDPNWIRIQSGLWIRFRIRIWNPDPDPDPGGQKCPTKVDKNL